MSALNWATIAISGLSIAISINTIRMTRKADAVIRELRLKRERPDYCNRCGIPHTTPCRREENR